MKKRDVLTLILMINFLFLFQGITPAQSYVLIGWNDLGMHCANKDFSKIAILPPYNNIYAQLVKKTPGQAPQLVTSGVFVEYSIPGNTYSVGKTNFWTYAQELFNLPQPLPDNTGLTGKQLTGYLDPEGNYFFARGIPVTPYMDNNLTNENPYQMIHIIAIDSSTADTLAATDVVIPISNEIGCVQSGCHSSEQSILNNHEDANLTPPVLCANCHGDNALGIGGNPNLPSLSRIIHSQHAELGLPPTLETCYKCHPGPNTQCLRGTMAQSGTICEDCHGTIYDVGHSISQGRQPWLEEPKCGDSQCHGSGFAEEPGKLFRESQGHGGLFCSACHGSPHAILPSREANDNLQNITLQGFAGILQVCSVCHGDNPTGGGPHGITPVELTSFSGRWDGKNVTLQWRTATEINNKGFEIERMPADNYSPAHPVWEKMGFTGGHGTTTEPQSYSFIDKNIISGSYFYRLKQIDYDGTYGYSNTVSINTGTELTFTLEQNYPNPFNPSTNIEYKIPNSEFVQIKIYDILGKEVETIVNEIKSAGTYDITWNAENLPGGVYFYKLKTGSYEQTKKMLLLK